MTEIIKKEGKINSTIYYMIGIPGSGKSYVAEEKSKEFGIPVLSSDRLRQELTGNAGDVKTYSHQEIFKRLRAEADMRIENEEGFIWDATGIDARFRREDIERFKKKGARIVGLVMITPKEICKERNNNRERTVPEDIIERMNEQSMSAEHTINTDYDLFDEVRIIDEKNNEISVYNRELKEGEGTINREVEIIPEFKRR